MPQSKVKTDQGWSWVVLVAAFFCNIAFDGIIFSVGLFYLDFLDYFGESRGRTSWIGSVISGTYSCVGPLASILANKFGCRAVTMVGALIASSGFVLCTFSPNIWVMIVTYGIMGGIGFGMMYLCAYVMICNYFDKYRALATGIASCGSGVGTFIFAQLAVVLVDTYLWQGAMLVIAGIVLNGVVMGAVFRPVGISTEEEEENVKQPLIDVTLFTSPAFIIMCASSFICMIGFFVPFIYLPDFANQIGLSKQQSAILLSIIGITNTIGRVICGFISDKPWADALKIYNGSLIVGGIATITCSWLNNFPLLCTYAAIFGVCVAAYVSLTAILLIEFLGLERLSNSFGFLNLFRGIATFIGAPLAGILVDVRGQYDLAFYIAGGAILFSGLICLPLRCVHSYSQNKPCTSSDTGQFSEPLRTGINSELRKSDVYGSQLTLAGSHMSIGLPNPYGRQTSTVSSLAQHEGSGEIYINKKTGAQYFHPESSRNITTETCLS